MTLAERDYLARSIGRRAFLSAMAGAAALPALTRLNSAMAEAQAGDALEEFVVANEVEPDDLLPFMGGYGQVLITRQVYQPLAETRLTLDENGVVQMELIPVLAERWERFDDTRWRFFLRPGVTFHNGEAWDAAAAKASFDALADQDLIASLGKFSILQAIASCEVVDEMTVDFVTVAPDTETVRMTLRVGFVGLPPALLAEQGITTLAEAPVGTGPYQFESWQRGQEIRLRRFEDYWDANGPGMQAVRYVARPEAAVRAQTIQAGEAHFAYNIGMEQAQTLDRHVIGGGFQSSGIRVNNTIPVTDDVRVRRALNLAIDRDAIVDAIFLGAAKPIAFFGFQPVQLEPFPYDPEQAAALIEEAGATGAELELVYGEGRIPEEDQLAEIYKASFDAIGLNVTLTKVEPRQYNEIGMRPFEEQPPLYLETTSSGNYGEIAGSLRDKYGCDGTGAFCDPALDQEYAELATLDGDERNAKLQSIAERLHTEYVPRVWVAAIEQVHGLAEGITTDLPANAWILLKDLSVS